MKSTLTFNLTQEIHLATALIASLQSQGCDFTAEREGMNRVVITIK